MKKKLIFITLVLISLSIGSLNNYFQELECTLLEDTQTQLQYTEWDIFLEALIMKESNGDPQAIGKTQDVGILQITPIYVKEANRLSGKGFTLEDRTSVEKSMEMFNIIQDYWNPDKNIDKAIKLHNPGAGPEYAEAIYKNMEIIKSRYNEYSRV